MMKPHLITLQLICISLQIRIVNCWCDRATAYYSHWCFQTQGVTNLMFLKVCLWLKFSDLQPVDLSCRFSNLRINPKLIAVQYQTLQWLIEWESQCHQSSFTKSMKFAFTTVESPCHHSIVFTQAFPSLQLIYVLRSQFVYKVSLVIWYHFSFCWVMPEALRSQEFSL